MTKKNCVGDPKLRDWTKLLTVIFNERYSAFATWFSFSVNKKKKNYKAKFSTNLILKKNQQR
jgi:hypothetical protein